MHRMAKPSEIANCVAFLLSTEASFVTGANWIADGGLTSDLQADLMKIESIDFFYLSMPKVTTEADGSQDALLVRVTAGGLVGYGECEAALFLHCSSGLPIIPWFLSTSAGFCTWKKLNTPEDIQRISQIVAYQSMDLLQAAHTYSGIEMALWDLLGKFLNEPVWRLLGYKNSYPKTPYFSVLFGDEPIITLERAKEALQKGFRAAKFGWGPIGKGTASEDQEHFQAAREGLGKEGILLVDTGQIFGDDVEKASLRIKAMEEANVLWFEEPFTHMLFMNTVSLQGEVVK